MPRRPRLSVAQLLAAKHTQPIRSLDDLMADTRGEGCPAHRRTRGATRRCSDETASSSVTNNTTQELKGESLQAYLRYRWNA
jgi:hypothetical protein